MAEYILIILVGIFLVLLAIKVDNMSQKVEYLLRNCDKKDEN